MKKLRVGPGAAEDFFAQASRVSRAADRGEPIAETFSMTFEDPEDVAQILTRARIGVFLAVKAEPASITAIASRLHRDRSAVKRDVDALRDAGLVTVETVTNAGHGTRKIIRATATRVDLRVSIA
ncbi:Transcriptional regulator [Paraburkholderia sabiae]|jgi:predicted transcriptional regulator|uniref:HVO_A0114 family putative DNA-binding protein n=1 Tax=Paraburkholderia sabiae TaxID=273251 RepID=UPI001CACCA07|nr:helix-turn-helix domain-containing protein [Paraburkholderia sabiae]CAG9213238.1 Transcriptional regulator [Paraburkholderia sabiae]